MKSADSEQLEAGDALDKNFRAMALDEIERFRREIIERSGDARSANNITDQELLREVMNTVGKPEQLGGSIRCVVSVSMLTEGWDANTVTHVLGIRAFGTLVHECDHWIKAIGEPELGSHYTAPMRINFLKIMQSALRKAFERPEPDPIENPPLEDLKSLLDDNKIVIFDLNFDLPTRHPSYANAVARMKKRRERKPE